MNNNFENELNQFFYIIEKKKEMGRSRRINEQKGLTGQFLIREAKNTKKIYFTILKYFTVKSIRNIF